MQREVLLWKICGSLFTTSSVFPCTRHLITFGAQANYSARTRSSVNFELSTELNNSSQATTNLICIIIRCGPAHDETRGGNESESTGVKMKVHERYTGIYLAYQLHAWVYKQGQTVWCNRPRKHAYPQHLKLAHVARS